MRKFIFRPLESHSFVAVQESWLSNHWFIGSRASTLFCIFQCVDVGKPFLISLLIKQMSIECPKKKLYSTGLVGIPLDAWECEKTGSIGTSWIQHCQFLSDGVLVDSPWYKQDGCVQWKQWNCRIDCQYFCMMQREQERGALGLSPVKYHWKWPFKLKNAAQYDMYAMDHIYMPHGPYLYAPYFTTMYIRINWNIIQYKNLVPPSMLDNVRCYTPGNVRYRVYASRYRII